MEQITVKLKNVKRNSSYNIGKIIITMKVKSILVDNNNNNSL